MQVSAGLGEGDKVVLTGIRDLEGSPASLCCLPAFCVGSGGARKSSLRAQPVFVVCAHFLNLPQLVGKESPLFV